MKRNRGAARRRPKGGWGWKTANESNPLGWRLLSPLLGLVVLVGRDSVAAAVRAATIVAVAGVVPAAVRAATIVAVAGLAGCGGDDAPAPPPEFDWAALLPASDFPPPRVPEDNPMTFDKVELGRRLFYDRRLSGNETQSCGDCHQQAFGFSDGRAVSPGSTGTLTFRNSMQLTNVGYATTLTWGNPLIRTLEAQALIPMFGEDPIELGLASQEQLFDRLRSDSLYPEQFDAAFPDQPDPINLQNVTRAIAAFERTLVAFDSPYDRAYYKGDRAAMSEAAYRGEALFFSEKFECFHCHGGANFSAATVHDGSPFVELAFFNTGLYNIDGDGGYPSPNTGVFEITQDPRDMGRMRPPSLRNVAVSAPYMHDGSLATLDDVLDHYARGGTLREGNNAGDGAESPLKSDFLVGFTFEGTEREDLKAFLQALTDDTFLNNPALAPVN